MIKQFQQYFSYADFQNVLGQDIQELNTDRFYEAVDLFLQENKILKSFTNHKTRRTNFGYALNQYLNHDCQQHQKENVLEGFLNKSIISIALSKKTLDENYNTLIEKVNNGNFTPFELVGDIYDFNSGKTFNLSLKNWEPTLMLYIPGEKWTDRGRFEVAPEEHIDKVIERQIEFKTGNLIVADWFKIKEFNDLVDSNNQFEINSEKGRIEQSEFYLNNFNFIHSTAWHSSEIYQDQDTFVFINTNEELNLPPTYKNKGYVNKELRAISIIELEHLIDLIGSKEIVNKYLEESKNYYVRLNVNPGTYTFTLSSDPHLIKESYGDINSCQNEENQEKIKELLQIKNFTPTLILQALSAKPSQQLKLR